MGWFVLFCLVVFGCTSSPQDPVSTDMRGTESPDGPGDLGGVAPFAGDLGDLGAVAPFAPATMFPVALPGQAVFATGDLNGDHTMDVLVATNGGPGGKITVQGFLNDGSGRLVAAMPVDTGMALVPLSLRAGDFHGSDKVDAIVGTPDATLFLAGKGDGTFVLGTPFAAGTPAVVADFDRDGKLDVLGIHGSDTKSPDLRVLLGHGDGTFGAGTWSWPAAVGILEDDVLAGDFNGDGNADLAVLPRAALPVVFLGRGGGTFAMPAPVDFGSGLFYEALADLDGDKKLDLIALPAFIGGVLVAPGKGDGTFALPPMASPAVTGQWSYPVAADFTLDGRADLVVMGDARSANGSGEFLLANDGTGSFRAARQISPLVLYPLSMAAADMNGDGKLDLIGLAASSHTSMSVVVMLNMVP